MDEVRNSLREQISRGTSDFQEMFVTPENFAKLVYSTNQNFVLYGAGFTCPDVMHILKKEGIELICLSDSDKSKAGGSILGIPILSPEDALHFAGADCICLVAIWSIATFYEDFLEKLKCIGYSQILFLDASIQPRIPPTKALIEDTKHKESEILAVFDKLSDDVSGLRYKSFIESLLTGRLENQVTHAVVGRYGSKDGKRHENDLVQLGESDRVIHCRCGYLADNAYLDALARTGAAWLFEPSLTGRIMTKEYMDGISSNSIQVLPYILSEIESEIDFKEKIRFGDYVDFEKHVPRSAKSIVLDDYMVEIAPTVIYLNMTGGLIEAVKGARQTIGRYKPWLIIEGFRKASEMTDIMLTFPEFEYKLRYFGGMTMREGYVLYAKT